MSARRDAMVQGAPSRNAGCGRSPRRFVRRSRFQAHPDPDQGGFRRDCRTDRTVSGMRTLHNPVKLYERSGGVTHVGARRNRCKRPKQIKGAMQDASPDRDASVFFSPPCRFRGTVRAGQSHTFGRRSRFCPFSATVRPKRPFWGSGRIFSPPAGPGNPAARFLPVYLGSGRQPVVSGARRRTPRLRTGILVPRPDRACGTVRSAVRQAGRGRGRQPVQDFKRFFCKRR